MTMNAGQGDRTAPFCQIHSIREFARPLTRTGRVFQFKNRLKRYIKRRAGFIGNVLGGALSAGNGRGAVHAGCRAENHTDFREGDVVRVKSRAGIRKTLSAWNDLKGCGFMEEMWVYCDTTHRIYKTVHQFLDERDYRVRKCSGVYLLEGAQCRGTADFGACDRSCYYFWRGEWLEKVPEEIRGGEDINTDIKGIELG